MSGAFERKRFCDFLVHSVLCSVVLYNFPFPLPAVESSSSSCQYWLINNSLLPPSLEHYPSPDGSLFDRESIYIPGLLPMMIDTRL